MIVRLDDLVSLAQGRCLQ